MDQFYKQIAAGNVGELRFLEPCLLERLPSEYWATNCFVTASFMHRDDCLQRERIGVEHIMWGSDYPHLEGTSPFSEAAIRLTFAGIARSEVQAMLGGNAAELYGFDMEYLRRLAGACGPRVDDVAAGLDAVPEGAASMAFRERPPQNM
jgi:hypothetical protein